MLLQEIYFSKPFQYQWLQVFISTVCGDLANRAHSRKYGRPFSVASVLSLLKEVLTATIVCMLEEHTWTFVNLARMNLSAEETFLNGRDAFCNFPHFAIKIGPFKEFHLEMSSNLQEIQIMFLFIHPTTLLTYWEHFKVITCGAIGLTCLTKRQDRTQSLKPIQWW